MTKLASNLSLNELSLEEALFLYKKARKKFVPLKLLHYIKYNFTFVADTEDCRIFLTLGGTPEKIYNCDIRVGEPLPLPCWEDWDDQFESLQILRLHDRALYYQYN